MKKLDIVAILLLMAINWFLLAIIYRYEYFITIFTKEQMHLAVKKLFIYGSTIILTLMVIPRWLNFIARRRITKELGDVAVAPFLNYHPEDVKKNEFK